MARTTTTRRKDGRGGKNGGRTARAATSRLAEQPTVPASREREPARLFSTKNDLPESIRVEVIPLLNQRLAECIDLQTQCKQAHWNVKGPSFIGLHKLFDEINESVEGYVDLIAERIVQLGGIAEGTIGAVEGRSTLVDYPLTISTGAEHVAALSDALAGFARVARVGIEEMQELKDADSADMLTDVSRGVDQWLWFVEAHQQEKV
ncbi:MAG: DNA starvation/stationary phase protection protein Dps [Gemmatimonadetes bacterium]|nr:MAG: DNA starvation/stationary phase protection protein Dps [Gemmatimonadota bacterium]